MLLVTSGVPVRAQAPASPSAPAPGAEVAPAPTSAGSVTAPEASSPADEEEPQGLGPKKKRKRKKKLETAAVAPTVVVPVLSVEAAETTTLARPLDPVVLPGSAFPSWLGVDIAWVRAYALKAGQLMPVPFQIDERAADGRYLYPEGIRNDATEIDGKLSAQDEIVLLAGDAGDRPPDGVVIPNAADVQWVTIEDPSGSAPTAPPDGGASTPASGDSAKSDASPGRGWFVLARYPGEPPAGTLVTEPRVTHEWAKNYIYSESYGIGFYDFAPPAHSAVPQEIRVQPVGGQPSPDLLDRFKWRVEISILWGLYTVTFDEENVRVQVLAYKEGPVRVLRYVACRVLLPFGIEGPSLTIDAAFYPGMAQIPLRIDVPHSPGFIGTHSDLILGVDLSPAAQGLLFYDSENPEGFLVDGWMSDQESAQHRRPDRWRLWAGAAGSMMERTFWDSAYLRKVKLETEYVDDVSDLRPPEDHNGQMGAYYERYRVDDLEPGTYRALLEWYFPGWGDYNPGDEAAVLKIRDVPLKAHVGEWTGPAIPAPPG